AIFIALAGLLAISSLPVAQYPSVAPLAAWLLAGPAPLPLALTRVELQRQDEAEPAEPGVAPGEGLAGVVLLGPISPNER
ncbi:hypothetical protein, partial [Achromobacter xylosoxidans]|uniref:hypothetical protein n=1 Tax=Alcaligenes xylosoxydans xylosoxydans TaxID=85698 RepID=UPI002ACA47CD